MGDYFELLGLPRRPWIDAEFLKRQFLARSERLHPDKLRDEAGVNKDAATENFAAVNAAHECLRVVKSRLGYLLELELEKKPKEVTSIPPDEAELFMEFNSMMTGVNRFLEKKMAAKTVIEKAAMMEEGLEWVDRLQAFQTKARVLQLEAEELAQGFNGAWELVDKVKGEERRTRLPLEKLEQAFRRSSYSGKWMAQVDRCLTGLAV